jgi:hypothetical protein
MTLVRGTGNTQTAQRSQGITPGDAFLMMLFESLGGGSPSDSHADSKAEDDEYWRGVHQQGCNVGVASDCAEANKDRIFPDPPPPDNF